MLCPRLFAEGSKKMYPVPHLKSATVKVGIIQSIYRSLLPFRAFKLQICITLGSHRVTNNCHPSDGSRGLKMLAQLLRRGAVIHLADVTARGDRDTE